MEDQVNLKKAPRKVSHLITSKQLQDVTLIRYSWNLLIKEVWYLVQPPLLRELQFR